MPNVMPKKGWPVLEGEIKLSDVGSQAFIEVEGDNWYASVTLTNEAITGLHEWLTCYRQARGI